MGDLKSIMGMIPGMSKLTKDLDIDNSAFTKVEAIIFFYDARRKKESGASQHEPKRIALGSGKSINDVNMFVKQFDQMRKMMQMMSTGKGMGNAIQQMQRQTLIIINSICKRLSVNL